MMRDENEPYDMDCDSETAEPESEAVDRLLEIAGPRQEAPAHVVARIKRATYPAWQSKVQEVVRARRRRRAWTLAAAASIGIAAALWQLAPQIVPASEPLIRVATVEATAGEITTGDAGIKIGTELNAGALIETGPRSHATLRLAGGTSARLDAQTVLRLATANSLELERGAVYLDTGLGSDGTSLAVSTRYGVARDIGTQFEVRLLVDSLRVQVREGEVDVNVGPTHHTVDAGGVLTVDADGTVDRDDVSSHGPAWAWVLQTSPPFELEGRTLGQFLEWVARETGWQMQFADPALEREVTDTVAHGSIAGAKPNQALDLVLPGYGLRYTRDDGTLVIDQAGKH